MSYRLVLALLLLASSCTPSANATERFRQNEGYADEPVVAVVSPTDEAEPVVPRPVGAELPQTENSEISVGVGDLTGSMIWTQIVRLPSFTTEVLVDVDLTGTLVPSTEAEAAVPGERSYVISGHVRVDASAGSCSSTTARSRCSLAAALDASIVGVATQQNGELTMRLSWRAFGSEQVSSRVGFSVAEWSIDAALGSTPFAVTPISAVADALEWSGLVGGTLFVDVRTGRPSRFSANIGSGFGDGLLYVVVDG